MKARTILISTAILLILAAGIFVSCDPNWKTWNVTLITNGGTIAPGKEVTQYVQGKGAYLPLASEITKEDYTFGGWYDTPDFTGEPVKFIGGTASGDKTFYAEWIEIQFYFITEDTQTLENGKRYTIAEDVTNSNRITVDGKAKLYLPDGYTLSLTQGITVIGENTLEINSLGEEGTGILDISDVVSGNAGIGGFSGQSCGSVIINGGKIVVTGGTDAAGIGGGVRGDGGNITINGGTVIATGGFNTGSGAAAIGGGGRGNGGTIKINGGYVSATGANDAAGIGGGHDGNGADLRITGGYVTTSSPAGKGIGGGNSNNGTLTIGDFDIPTEKGHLRIAEGWCLYYGNEENPHTPCKGPIDTGSYSSYCSPYMDVVYSVEHAE